MTIFMRPLTVFKYLLEIVSVKSVSLKTKNNLFLKRVKSNESFSKAEICIALDNLDNINDQKFVFF